MHLQETETGALGATATGAVTLPRIRASLSREDWAYARELCARTGKAGDAIARERWPFFGELWVGPYEKLCPEWSYVADGSGGRMGYLTGCPDTRSFNRRKKLLFDLPLYLRCRAGAFVPNADRARFEARFAGREVSPDDTFDPRMTEAVIREFPAHLHVNLEASARGSGLGRRLIDRFREDLAAIGVRGVHLTCGDKPLPFYRKVGFAEIDRIEYRPGVFVHRLGCAF
jgi:GNAT superfamily N-acetyltransferase